MTYKEYLESDLTKEQYIALLAKEGVAAEMAKLDAARAATRAAEEEASKAAADAFRAAVVHDITATRPRLSLVDDLVTKAAEQFELKEGKIVARSGIINRRDPVAEYTLVDWLADLHMQDDNIFWEKKK